MFIGKYCAVVTLNVKMAFNLVYLGKIKCPLTKLVILINQGLNLEEAVLVHVCEVTFACKTWQLWFGFADNHRWVNYFKEVEFFET